MGKRAAIAPTRITLQTPIEAVPGVPRTALEAMRRLGIVSVAHLIQWLPVRHEFEEAESGIDQLKPGVVGTVRGEVTATRLAGMGRKQRFQAVLMDHTGRVDIVWFHQAFLNKRILPGMRLRVQGKPQRYGLGLQMANPMWEPLKDEADEPTKRDARLRPVYPASEQAPSRMIERAVDRVLDAVLPALDDHLPEVHRRERAMPELREAYRMIHRPTTPEEAGEARRRLAYDELLMMQLAVQMKRSYMRRTLKALALDWSPKIDERIRARIPFALTEGQERVVEEITKDLRQSVPSNRLIQGDVGSGKTAVALYAMLMAVATRHQAALMAPTELLAEQHHTVITRMLAGSDVRIALLTGSLRDADRQDLLGRIERGEIDIVVGTHALLTEATTFASLALVVIDEQHRFGVHQRARLREKAGDPGSSPHVLVMTATPIPRTLALTVFGDLDVSTIQGLPPGRRPVRTRIVTPDRSDEVYDWLRTKVEAGEQAYIVVPAIEEGTAGGKGLASVRAVQRRLEEGPLAGRRIAAVHGKLKRDTRERVMERFRSGATDVLVATTVIEVGVDVPNATIMIIEQAERFGLAQIHQLRGRVGRGRRSSACVLIAQPTTDEAAARLRAIASTTDGFTLAARDLEIRGPGEIIGARQAGAHALRVAELPRDTDLLMLARRDAAAWIERSPTLSSPDESTLKRRLFKAFGQDMGLADIA